MLPTCALSLSEEHCGVNSFSWLRKRREIIQVSLQEGLNQNTQQNSAAMLTPSPHSSCGRDTRASPMSPSTCTAQHHRCFCSAGSQRSLPIIAAPINSARLPARFCWELSFFAHCTLRQKCPVEPDGFVWKRKLHTMNPSPLLSTLWMLLQLLQLQIIRGHLLKVRSLEGMV